MARATRPPQLPIEVVPPSGWGAQVDYDNWPDRYTIDEAFALHHGGSGDYNAANEPFTQEKEMALLRRWENFHINGRGWRGLGYGWGIGQTGTIYRARGWNTYAAHRGDLDDDGIRANEEVVPIILLLSGLRHQMSDAMKRSIRMLRGSTETTLNRHLSRNWPMRLHGHREIQSTTCPGPIVMDYVRAHRFLPEVEMSDATAVINGIKHALNAAGFRGAGGEPLPEDGEWDANVQHALTTMAEAAAAGTVDGLDDDERRMVADMLGALDDRGSNGTFVGFAVDLIRKERSKPLHAHGGSDPEADHEHLYSGTTGPNREIV